MIELSYLSISKDWYGDPVQPALDVGLVIEDQHLVFGGRRKAPAVNVDGFKALEFYEGLWEADCVELFLGFVGSERYLEINLAPNGSWAIFVFSNYRKREEVLSDYTPKVFSKSDKDSWASQIKIEKNLLLDNLLNSEVQQGKAETFLYNITGVLADSHKLRYLTLESGTQTEPDFHLDNLRKTKL